MVVGIMWIVFNKLKAEQTLIFSQFCYQKARVNVPYFSAVDEKGMRVITAFDHKAAVKVDHLSSCTAIFLSGTSQPTADQGSLNKMLAYDVYDRERYLFSTQSDTCTHEQHEIFSRIMMQVEPIIDQHD